MITADVGVTRLTRPDADWNAVTTIDRDTPAKSASGARIGMTSAACPDEDGTRNAIGRLTSRAMRTNTPWVVPETAFSIQHQDELLTAAERGHVVDQAARLLRVGGRD